VIALDRATRGAHGATWAALFASAGTLVCCALPALLVTIGAGAVLASAVSAVPQLVWLSEHKLAVFATAAVLLSAAGVLQWRARAAPCPSDPALASACARARRMSRGVYFASLGLFAIGGWFAFVAPVLTG